MLKIDLFTGIACLLIITTFIIFWYYISTRESKELIKKRQQIEQLPSIISTLGVLGTFIGITKGLIHFDTLQIDDSIRQLLNGLKTAFFTSLLGMTGSLILSKIVNAKFEKEAQESDIQKAANQIVEALNHNHEGLLDIIKQGNKDLVAVFREDEAVKIIRQDVEQLKDDIEEMKGLCQDFKTILEDIGQYSKDITDETPRIRAVLMTSTASVSTIDNRIDEIASSVESLEKNSNEQQLVLDSKFTTIHATLKEINDKITEITDNINR